MRLTVLAAAVASLAAPTSAADFTWTTGDFSGAIAPSPLLAGDTLTIDSGGTKRFVGGAFTNQGTVVWLNDNLQGGNSASVSNAGLWDARSDTTSLSFNFGGQPTFTNTGIFRKSGGSGNTTVGSWAFINDGGTLDAQSGTLLFNGGSAFFNAGSRFTGAGAVNIASHASFSGGFRADNLLFSGGSFTGSAASFDGGVASSAGAATWQGGDLHGSWTIGSDATLTAVNGGGKRQIGGSLVNNGSVLWNSSDAFQGGNSGSFTNNGLFDARQ
ncbi:MAG: hypothetical protein IT509_08165, partial [Rhodocyclaceae bacterium]|nr:hypothetical protein [Rhodocyclaceae bacterium]